MGGNTRVAASAATVAAGLALLSHLLAGGGAAARSGLASAARAAGPEPSAPALLPVPIVSQGEPWSCGGAALMAALTYFGRFDDAQSRLDAELGSTERDGTRVPSIVRVARRFGLSAEARTGLELPALARELARGAVVIVAIQAWPDAPVAEWRTRWEDGHYVVVVGLTGDRVYVMDPSVRAGYAYLPREQFRERWHDYELDERGRRVEYDRLGIVIEGERALGRYPAPPVPVN